MVLQLSYVTMVAYPGLSVAVVWSALTDTFLPTARSHAGRHFNVCMYELLFGIKILLRLMQTVKVGICYNWSEYDLLDSLCRTRKLKSRDTPALYCYLPIIAWFINSASYVLIPYTLSSMSGLDSGIASLLNCAYGSHIHGSVRQL